MPSAVGIPQCSRRVRLPITGERGGDNLFESGRVGGWHGHYEVQGASLEFDRLINAGRRPFGRLAVLSAYCGAGGGSKKEGAPRPGA